MIVALIPARNESATISQVILGSWEFVDKVVVCDDGSTDNTSELAEGVEAEVIHHETNWGKGDALRSLFLKAIEMDADKVITIDADLQHDPKDIPRLLEALNDADIVIGSRVGLSKVRGAGNRILSGSKMDSQSGFRAYRGSVLPFLIPSEQGYGADAEILGLAKARGLRIAQVPIMNVDSVPNPHKANIAYHFADAFLTHFKMLTFRHPLVSLGVPGLVLVLIGLGFAWSDFSYLVSEGFGSVLLVMLGLSLASTALIIWVVVSLVRRIER